MAGGLTVAHLPVMHDNRRAGGPQGWGKQVLIAQDICNSHRLERWGGHGYHYILAEVVPRQHRLP